MLTPKENIKSLKPMIIKRKRSKKGHNYLSNVFKLLLGHLHIGHKRCAKYHVPSLSGYPDILFTISLMAKMPTSEQRA